MEAPGHMPSVPSPKSVMLSPVMLPLPPKRLCANGTRKR